MPSKVMIANDGLKEISHSITGGSISAQGMCCSIFGTGYLNLPHIGYWLPFEAAKAVAARFCYEIRYVLVPVFGPDFVSMCKKCGDPEFLKLGVDPNIIARCTEAIKANQMQSRESSISVSPRTHSAYATSKSLQPKHAKAMDVESGYGTDTDRSENYPGSPDSFRSIEWTPVNSPRLAHVEAYPFLQRPPRNFTSTPRGLDSPKASHSKRMANTKRGISEIDEASDVGSSSDYSSMDAPASPKRRKRSGDMTPEVGAAYTLMELNMADTTLGERKPLKRRRASA